LSNLPYVSHLSCHTSSNPSGITFGICNPWYSDSYGGCLAIRQKKRHFGSEKEEVRSSGRSDGSSLEMIDWHSEDE
jgi:hypothetical protein